MVTDAHLLELNRLGLIPGPTEGEEAFLRRAEECLHLSGTLFKQTLEDLGFTKNEQAVGPLLEEPLRRSRELYDSAPDWIPILFSNQGLAPWHGGCAWICQLEDQSPTVAFFQLRKSLSTKARYLGCYQRSELIAHELSHVGRMTFEEPQFEEILAFRSSSSPIRRWLGPILQSSREAFLFILTLLFSMVFDLSVLLYPTFLGIEWALGLKLIPLGMIGFGLGRLAWRQRRFNRCIRNLEVLFGDAHRAQAVIYRLKDDEISLFSRLSSKAILHYAYQRGRESLRWRLLMLAYFSVIKS